LWKNTAERPQDSPLSEEGFIQAKELAKTFENSNVRFIFSSPFVRALQTANEIAELLNLDIKVENGLVEWLGSNHIVEPQGLDELAKLFPRIDTNFKSLYPIPGRESKKFLFERCKQLVIQLKKRYMGHSKGSIILITHAAPVIAI